MVRPGVLRGVQPGLRTHSGWKPRRSVCQGQCASFLSTGQPAKHGDLAPVCLVSGFRAERSNACLSHAQCCTRPQETGTRACVRHGQRVHACVPRIRVCTCPWLHTCACVCTWPAIRGGSGRLSLWKAATPPRGSWPGGWGCGRDVRFCTPGGRVTRGVADGLRGLRAGAACEAALAFRCSVDAGAQRGGTQSWWPGGSPHPVLSYTGPAAGVDECGRVGAGDRSGSAPGRQRRVQPSAPLSPLAPWGLVLTPEI